MLLFHPADDDALAPLQQEGTPAGAVFFSSLEEARRHGDGGSVLVADPEAHPELWEAAETGDAPPLPPSAFENLDPYVPPEPVVAAGGYVLRPDERSTELAERAVLLIRKRGVWDLPKGKQDPGEDVRACALREVREETGLEAVRALGALGSTLHGYPDEGADGRPRYCVKTTHWFLMDTPETDLAPEREEGIEKVVWMRWGDAAERLGYDTLRRHLRRAGPRARALLRDA
ncbi:MAG: NUDIX hydrolase [Bacteroidetes bacterium QH_8_67_23]|nr:MAG: NUDIX hydrolase [Bacteroidetes bacterium QH_8_67_23]